jgi:hypothetical protein
MLYIYLLEFEYKILKNKRVLLLDVYFMFEMDGTPNDGLEAQIFGIQN